jgi:hypothetical protein
MKSLLIMALIALSVPCHGENDDNISLDYDRQAITCGDITYQFDFQDRKDLVMYSIFESAYLSEKSTDDADFDLCEGLNVYFCTTSQAFVADNPHCKEL